MIRILIADDHTVVRQGLKMILSEQSDIKIVGDAENSDELFQLLRTTKCDVVILDLSMPGRSGLEVLRDVHAMNPEQRILVLSMLPEEQFARRALKTGASGYVSKGSPPSDIIQAIRKLYNGGRYISASLAEQLAADLSQDSDKLEHERLSNREFDVFLKIASGQSVKDIAEELAISTKTVTTYRARILEKMNLNSNADITRYVLEHHIVG